MGIRAYAIVNDMGVLFRDRQLLVYPRRADADRARALINLAEDGEFDGRVVRVSIDVAAVKTRLAASDGGDGSVAHAD